MSKIKMRCTTCGKWFQSANAKEITCPDCLQKARKEKLAAKATQHTSTSKSVQGGISSSKPVPPPPPKTKEATRGTSHWIDAVEDVEITDGETRFRSLPREKWLRRALLYRHIRRLDPALIILQRLIEAALFFHPAVWLISRQLEWAGSFFNLVKHAV